MKRLIVVSNRLPAPRPSAVNSDPQLSAGGLVSALLDALEALPRSVWVGWDGRAPGGRSAASGAVRTIRLRGLPLERPLVAAYYDGFCNQALWPLLHCFPGRALFEPAHVEAYLAVQERFADAVAAEAGRGDGVWVHDFHLLGVGEALRRRGVGRRLGFFLHTPFPPDEIWSILPRSRRFLEAMLSYDLVGFHTRRYLGNYVQACLRELGATWDGERLRFGEREQRVGVYPVGISASEFEPDPASIRRVARESALSRMVRGRRAVLGVDRLDYTKGLIERVRAFELFLRAHPHWHDRVSLVQIAAPTRSKLPYYERERDALERLVSRVNGELGRVDWVPIRYLHRTFPRETLRRFYRGADVALVTPLRDGMNLVAKEYVAAQRPDRPGVLILSRFAGAAEQLDAALLVNPYVPAEAAEAIRAALEMPFEERSRRHAQLLARVRGESATDWARRFLADLAG